MFKMNQLVPELKRILEEWGGTCELKSMVSLHTVGGHQSGPQSSTISGQQNAPQTSSFSGQSAPQPQFNAHHYRREAGQKWRESAFREIIPTLPITWLAYDPFR
ncbi:hypothetical protein LguiA_012359 [Lonicera macranthoides]